MISPSKLLVSMSVLAALVVACKGEKKSEPQAAADAGFTTPTSAPITAAAAAEANDIFATRCTTCHGPSGEGDGPASATLSPKPRNLRDPSWQASVNDDHIEKIIQYGGAAVGKSPAMPPNPDLVGRPQIVAALRGHIRSLKK